MIKMALLLVLILSCGLLTRTFGTEFCPYTTDDCVKELTFLDCSHLYCISVHGQHLPGFKLIKMKGRVPGWDQLPTRKILPDMETVITDVPGMYQCEDLCNSGFTEVGINEKKCKFKLVETERERIIPDAADVQFGLKKERIIPVVMETRGQKDKQVAVSVNTNEDDDGDGVKDTIPMIIGVLGLTTSLVLSVVYACIRIKRKMRNRGNRSVDCGVGTTGPWLVSVDGFVELSTRVLPSVVSEIGGSERAISNLQRKNGRKFNSVPKF